MEIEAVTKYIRMPPQKARAVARAVQGLPVAEALNITGFNPQKGAFEVGKTLKSAIANAENNFKLDASRLFVKMAVVEDGPALRRHWPRSRGMVRSIKRRMGHVRIVLAELPEQKKQSTK